MARVLVLTDRLPKDTDWKGAYTWDIIMQLAESQHEVMALTTSDVSEITLSHPRLTIARPAPSFGVGHLPMWIKSILGFHPEVIHTFALKPDRRPAWTTVWPFLNASLKAFPRVRRISTFFSASELDSHPSRVWHQDSAHWAHFGSIDAAADFKGPLMLAPIELGTFSTTSKPSLDLIVPAPVSEWEKRKVNLLYLSHYLEGHTDLSVKIIGGWGESSLSERRHGWMCLKPVSDRVHMLEPMSLVDFAEVLAGSRGLWLHGAETGSWRHRISQALAQQLNVPIFGPTLDIAEGSTANFLSRIYNYGSV